jgi:transposase
MTMLAEVVDAVIGGDTHLDTHTLEIATPAGVPIAVVTVGNDPAGYAAAIGWARAHAPGPRLVFALEGTRSYGVGLARAVTAAGLRVIEVERPRRAERRRGKSDPIDAHLAVLSALRMRADRLPAPRADGAREALRILLGARAELTTSRTRQVNRLRALLLTGNDTDRALRSGPLTATRLAAITRRRGRADDPVEVRVRRAEATRLALAIGAADHALRANRNELNALVADLAPTLLALPGVGPVSAAQAIVSFSHPGRCRDDAAFAALAGTAPLPADSGRRTGRHRLNRGGDRALNRAIHTIALTRLRSDERTRAYLTRRRADGKTDREIRRILKRYITREIFRTLTTALA